MPWSSLLSLWRTIVGKRGLVISGHNETQEPLPEDVLQKLIAAKNFNSATALVRQLEFAIFGHENSHGV